jgi:hypothetical protein
MNWFTQKFNTRPPMPKPPRAQASGHTAPLLHTQADLAHAAVLDARQQDAYNTQRKIEQAQRIMAQCAHTPVHHTGPLQATAQGRTKRFLNAFRTSANVKFGTGQVVHLPTQASPQERPVHPEVVLRRTEDVAKVALAKVTQIRQADQLLRQSKEEVIRGNPGLANYYAYRAGEISSQQLEATKSPSAQALLDANQALQAAQATYTHAHAQQTECKQKIQRLDTEIKCEQAHYLKLTQDKDQLLSSPSTTAMQALQEEHVHTTARIHQYSHQKRQAQQKLSLSQDELHQAQRQLKQIRKQAPFKLQERQKVHDAIKAGRKNIEQRTLEHQRSLAIVHRAQTYLAHINADLQELQTQAQDTQRLDFLTEEIKKSALKIRTLEADDIQQHAQHALNAPELEELQARLEQAQAHHRVAAQELSEVSDQVVHHFDVRHKIDQHLFTLPEHEAQAMARAQEALVEFRAAQHTVLEHTINAWDTLIQSPAGFLSAQVTPELQTQLEDLTIHLLDGQDERDARDIVATLNSVSHCLAMACHGDATLAAKALANIMECPLTQWAQPTQPWPHPQVQAQAKTVACLLTRLPGGIDILSKISRPAPTPPNPLTQKAIRVFLLAEPKLSAISAQNTPLTQAQLEDQAWLEDAQMAALALLNPGNENPQLKDLEPQIRQAFNGVSNNFTTIAQGSLYQRLNQSLLKFIEQTPKHKPHWHRGPTQEHITPFHAKKLASGVTTSMGLTGPDVAISKELQTACGVLLKISQSELDIARQRARQNGTQVPTAMLQAHCVLEHIERRGLKAGTSQMGTKAWIAINHATQKMLKAEKREMQATPPTEKSPPSLLDGADHFNACELQISLEKLHHQHASVTDALCELRDNFVTRNLKRQLITPEPEEEFFEPLEPGPSTAPQHPAPRPYPSVAAASTPHTPEPESVLNTALQNAKTKRELLHQFRSERIEFSARALEQWIQASVTNDSPSPEGLNLTGRLKAPPYASVSRLAQKFMGYQKSAQFRFTAKGAGLEMSLPRCSNSAWSLEIESEQSDPTQPSQLGGNTPNSLTRGLSQTLANLLTFEEQNYATPLEALLDQDPPIHIGTLNNTQDTAQVNAQFTATQAQKLQEQLATQGLDDLWEAQDHTAGLPVERSLEHTQLPKTTGLTTLSNRHDGTIGGAVHTQTFSGYAKFAAALEPHWDHLILQTIQNHPWPDDFAQEQKRTMAEGSLQKFMTRCQENAKLKPLKFKLNREIKPEVLLQLNHLRAAQQIALAQQRHADVQAMQRSSQQLLSESASYTPLFVEVERTGLSNITRQLTNHLKSSTAKPPVFDRWPNIFDKP